MAGKHRATCYGYGYGFKLGLHRSPTSLPLVYLLRRASLALGRASMFGGVTTFSRPAPTLLARAPLVATHGRCRAQEITVWCFKPPLALGSGGVGHRPPWGSVPSRLPRFPGRSSRLSMPVLSIRCMYTFPTTIVCSSATLPLPLPLSTLLTFATCTTSTRQAAAPTSRLSRRSNFIRSTNGTLRKVFCYRYHCWLMLVSFFFCVKLNCSCE